VATPWNEDPPGSEAQLLANARAVLEDIAERADERESPTVSAAQDWHRRLYDGLALPVSYYAGEIRNADPRYPELDGYEVVVGPFQGVPSRLVPQALATFEGNAQQAVERLDPVLSVGQPPATNQDLHAVLTLCALLHGEWVRIHPFANGNGRTARLWANWAALRYALPPFVTIKPRPPGDPYALAAAAGMQGQHQVAVAAFDQLLRLTLGELGS
jgi:fido (protein-threonine AMPylation protein)